MKKSTLFKIISFLILCIGIFTYEYIPVEWQYAYGFLTAILFCALETYAWSKFGT